MKNTFLFFLFIFIANTVNSQDLIVTSEGDSINCKISKVKSDNIYFVFNYKGEIRSTLLPNSSIKTYQFKYFQTSEVPKEKIVMHGAFQHLRVALNGGYSYHTAKIAENIPSDFKDYAEDLKSGSHFGGDITYFFSEPLGVGLKYCQFKTSNSMDDVYMEDGDGNVYVGRMSDDLTISFIGPMFSSRFFDGNKRNAMFMNLSLGYMSYSDNKFIIIDRYKMTGKTVGVSLDFGYDVALSKKVSLGFQISLLTGTLFEYELSDGHRSETVDLDIGEYESLNRIDLSIGLRFGR
jgi:hypothetical protein